MISDLLAETRRHAPVSRDEHSLRLDLEAAERAFGRPILDERVRSSVEAARERAVRLCEAVGRPSETALYTFAADLFVSLAVERPWRPLDAHRFISSLTEIFKADSDEIALQLLTAALRAPQLLELPPTVALDVQLAMLLSLSPVVEGSVWVRGEHGRVECLVTVGETAMTRRFRAIAVRTLEGRGAESDRGLIVGVPIRRWQTPWGALVVRVRTRELVDAVLEEASSAISPLVERDFLLKRSADREHTLVKASERRLSRLGFDLHDGALQKIALIRVVQEALTNIREHSNATSVELHLTASRSCVELQIVDDGDDFEVTRTLQSAAQRGRLGLVGSSERVRLLGGTFDIRSRIGGPTTIAVTLPRWQPLAAEEASLQLA